MAQGVDEMCKGCSGCGPEGCTKTMGERMSHSASMQEHAKEHGLQGGLQWMVHVWILNSKGEFLLQRHVGGQGRRAWFTTAGFVQAGEDSAAAARRLCREELGLELQMDRSAVVLTYKQEHAVTDVWLVYQETELESLAPDSEQVGAVRHAAMFDIGNLLDNGEMISMPYYDRFFEIVFRAVDAGV